LCVLILGYNIKIATSLIYKNWHWWIGRVYRGDERK